MIEKYIPTLSCAPECIHKCVSDPILGPSSFCYLVSYPLIRKSSKISSILTGTVTRPCYAATPSNQWRGIRLQAMLAPKMAAQLAASCQLVPNGSHDKLIFIDLIWYNVCNNVVFQRQHLCKELKKANGKTH